MSESQPPSKTSEISSKPMTLALVPSKKTQKESKSSTPATVPQPNGRRKMGVSTGARGKMKTALTNIEEAFGGRENIIATLPFGALNERHQRLLQLLADPHRVGDSLALLCTEAEILPGELIDIYRSADNAKQMALAHRVMNERLPDVVNDVTDKSVDQRDEKGGLIRESTIEHQRLFGEWSGLSPKKGGVNVKVGVQTNVNLPSPGGLFSKLVRSTDQAAYDITATDVESPKHGPEDAG